MATEISSSEKAPTAIHNDKSGSDEELLPTCTQPAFTAFSKAQLRQLQLLLGIATITSPLTATIYFPLLPLLRNQFHTSAQAINLTLTLYIIFQAISPLLFGPLSDSYGRRPFFLLTLGLYVVGNIGLAANKDNYAVLLVLRAIQSLGASAAYAISFGVVADVCESKDRGRMLGPISMALNLGACIGPVIGGVVVYTSGSYVWVFYALVIVGFGLFCGVGIFLPETARSLVGNGGDPSRFNSWQLSWLGLVRRRFGKSPTRGELEVPAAAKEAPKTVIRAYGLGNILAALRIIFHRDTFLVLWVHGSFYTVDYSFVAAVPDIFQDIYGFNDLELGLAYLPRGVGIVIGSYFTGKMLDINYRAIRRATGRADERVTGDDLLNFPIELARTRFSYYLLAISTATIIGYGWAIDRRAPVAVPLVVQFIQGLWGTAFYNTYGALLVDGFPQSPSTAAAATSVTRCAMAAAGVAVLQPLLTAAGRGWYFTTLGLWSGGFGVLAVLLLRWKGMKWRRLRSGISSDNQ
ncbi:MFS general substrate transporter [Trichoderma austrokoningii]